MYIISDLEKHLQKNDEKDDLAMMEVPDPLRILLLCSSATIISSPNPYAFLHVTKTKWYN